MALGTVEGPFRDRLLQQFFPTQFPDWHLVEPEPRTTDALWEAATHAPVPWNVVLVTTRLEGSAALTTVLGQIAVQWPDCHIVVITEDDPTVTRILVTQLAAFRIYNILFGAITPKSLTDALTRKYEWSHIQDHLAPTAPPPPPAPGGGAPRSAVPAMTQPGAMQSYAAPRPVIVSNQVIAVVSGKGGVGKSGWTANMATALGQLNRDWTSLILDVDYLHPGSLMYFRDPTQPAETDLRQIITNLDTNHRRNDVNDDPSDWSTWWTEADSAAVQRFIERSIAVAPGVQLIPGPSRQNPVPPLPQPGLVHTMIFHAAPSYRVVWLDTPSLPTDDVVVEAVRDAQHIVIITTPLYPSILESIDLIRKFERLQIPKSKLWLAITQRGRSGYTTADMVNNYFKGIPLLGEWAYDPPQWESALQRHQPLALTNPKPWIGALRKLTGITVKDSARTRGGGLRLPWHR